MKIISGPRGTGKTKELIKYSLETNTPIFCYSEQEQQAIVRKSIEHFERVCATCTISTVNMYDKVLVKNMEDCLNHLFKTNFGASVAGGTVGTDEED